MKLRSIIILPLFSLWIGISNNIGGYNAIYLFLYATNCSSLSFVDGKSFFFCFLYIDRSFATCVACLFFFTLIEFSHRSFAACFSCFTCLFFFYFFFTLIEFFSLSTDLNTRWCKWLMSNKHFPYTCTFLRV